MKRTWGSELLDQNTHPNEKPPSALPAIILTNGSTVHVFGQLFLRGKPQPRSESIGCSRSKFDGGRHGIARILIAHVKNSICLVGPRNQESTEVRIGTSKVTIGAFVQRGLRKIALAARLLVLKEKRGYAVPAISTIGRGLKARATSAMLTVVGADLVGQECGGK